jgi:hypothetical protein
MVLDQTAGNGLNKAQAKGTTFVVELPLVRS